MFLMLWYDIWLFDDKLSLKRIMELIVKYDNLSRSRFTFLPLWISKLLFTWQFTYSLKNFCRCLLNLYSPSTNPNSFYGVTKKTAQSKSLSAFIQFLIASVYRFFYFSGPFISFLLKKYAIRLLFSAHIYNMEGKSSTQRGAFLLSLLANYPGRESGRHIGIW